MSGKPTAVHFSLIFFVMLSLILGVVSYMMYRSYEEAEQRRVASDEKSQNTQSLLRRRDDEIQALKALYGYSYDEIGVDDQANVNKVLGRAKADIAQYGADSAGQTFAETLANMRQRIDTLTAEKLVAEAKINDLQTEIGQINAREAIKVSNADDARVTAEKDLATLVASQEEKIQAKVDENQQLRQENNRILAELADERDGRAQDNKRHQEEINNINIQFTRVREKLEGMEKTSFEVPDGVIRWIDNVSGVVWINLGESDDLPKRMHFSVYNKTNDGVGRGPEDVKGAIEVTRIIGPHLAEARILKDDIYNPFSRGDVIYTPLWSPGRSENFSFVGHIDLDGDGKWESDRHVLHELVANAKARIDNEVDDRGNRSGQGIDVNTKFLVVGHLPDPTLAASPEEQEIADRILKHYKDMESEARQQGVRRVNLSDFLAYIGYRPSRRLWLPGEGTPYTLKSGAHSTTTDETIGRREASGQTSGVYSRSPRLKQPTSTGQTSKLFGGGYGGR